jgi:hypothetical protein
VQYVTATQADGHPWVVRLNSPEDFQLDSSACAQGGPCQVGVRFQPSSAGDKYVDLYVTDRVTGSNAVVHLQGTGGLPQISVSPSSVVFPTQEIGSTWAYQPVQIKNVGDARMAIQQITLSGTNVGDFSISSNTCTYWMNPASDCQLLISFVPHALGERTATVQIISDSETGGTIEVPISATSTAVPPAP